MDTKNSSTSINTYGDLSIRVALLPRNQNKVVDYIICVTSYARFRDRTRNLLFVFLLFFDEINSDGHFGTPPSEHLEYSKLPRPERFRCVRPV